MVVATDQYGTKIQIGDFITYPVRQGSSMWMQTAVVYDIDEVPRWSWRDDSEMDARLKAKIVTTKDWRSKEKILKKVTIGCTERVTVLGTPIPRVAIEEIENLSRS